MDKDSFMMRFYSRHPILSHVGIMVALSVFLALGAMLFLNIWTLHGRSAEVPDVRGLSAEAAQIAIEDAGLKMQLYDSVYDDTLRLPSGRVLRHVPGGTVIKTLPLIGSTIKPGRTVYVTIKAYSPESILIHNPLNVSSRQVKDDFRALGIESIREEFVPSEYDDLVTRVTANGHTIVPGSTIPKNARIVLYIGKSDLLHNAIDEALDNLPMPSGPKKRDKDGNLIEEDEEPIKEVPDADLKPVMPGDPALKGQ